MERLCDTAAMLSTIFCRKFGYDGHGQVTGDLTLRGVTKPVTLDVTYNGAGKSFGHPGATLGFSAIGKINRSDWGMDYLTNFGIGDEVTLRIEAEFNEKQ